MTATTLLEVTTYRITWHHTQFDLQGSPCYSNLMACTGHSSAASLILSSKRDKSTPSITVFKSPTALKTSGQVFPAKPQQIQFSSIQTRVIDIIFSSYFLLRRFGQIFFNILDLGLMIAERIKCGVIHTPCVLRPAYPFSSGFCRRILLGPIRLVGDICVNG